MQKRLQLLIAMLVLVVSVAMAQVTTSGISGKVTSQGEEVIGATVTATHQPSGTVYRAVTNTDGRFSIQGMRPGGPYKVEVSYIGYQPKTFKDVSLNLGESQNLSCTLQEDAHELQEVVVSGKAGLNGTKTGAAQSINAQQIAEMPSISHSIADIARMNAQVSTNGQSGAMSFAGINNRYNSFQIDGVMNNDVFGLTSNGSNGGQANTQPVSMETVDQIQINIAPFDVRQGGFTGGAINAVTKSGTTKTSLVATTSCRMELLEILLRMSPSVSSVSHWAVLSSRTSCSSLPTMRTTRRPGLHSMVMALRMPSLIPM